MAHSKKYFLTALTALALTACSSEAKKTDLDKQVAQEKPADSPQEIAKRAAESFSNAPGLTADQKMKLRDVYAKTYAEAAEIRREIGQSKSLLFKTLAKNDYKSKEIEQLKNKIVDLDKKRLSIMFQSMEDVQKIIGYGKDREEIYQHLRDCEFPSNYRISHEM